MKIDASDILGNMKTGELPLSIGTSFAIESSLGILKDRDINGDPIPTAPKPPPLLKTNELWISVRTLVRNLWNAIDTEIRDDVLPGALLEVVLNEMRVIPDVISQVMSNPVKTVFYSCSYRSIPRVFPKAILKEVKTQKQQHYWMMEQHVAGYFHNEYKGVGVERYDVKITGNHPAAFILTHHPVDLLWRYSFNKLELLESHTGVIKPPSQWISKVNGGKENPHLPFNQLTLQVFGDGQFFSPVNHGMKKMLLELSLAKKWTPITTRDKILMDLGSLKDHAVREHFVSLFEKL